MPQSKILNVRNDFNENSCCVYLVSQDQCSHRQEGMVFEVLAYSRGFATLYLHCGRGKEGKKTLNN